MIFPSNDIIDLMINAGYDFSFGRSKDAVVLIIRQHHYYVPDVFVMMKDVTEGYLYPDKHQWVCEAKGIKRVHADTPANAVALAWLAQNKHNG